ncbi:MAG: DUF5458 family protein, partial [Pedobacter sp.]|nr:DUF5458 family protein [Pedobacter sp.]
MSTPEEQKITQDAAHEAAFKPAEKQVQEKLSLQESLDKLARVGGFDLLEATVDGLQNLNPERKARKQIFLTGDEKKKEREELKKKIQLWIDVLEESDSVADMTTKSTEKLLAAEENLNKNIAAALETTRELEQAYRSVNLFYQNTESDKLKNVVLLNASMDQIKDLDNPRFIDYVGDELKQKYDRLDLRDNYSLMVIPGYMGSNKVVEKWGKIAYE